MKRFTQCICILLLVALFFAVPVLAAEDSENRASNYFASNSQYLYKTSDSSFDICFNVTGLGTMEELGASKVIVQRAINLSDWEDVETFTRDDYPDMIGYGEIIHASSIPYDAERGYYYRIYILYYAKNDSGSAYFHDYSSSIKL